MRILLLVLFNTKYQVSHNYYIDFKGLLLFTNTRNCDIVPSLNQQKASWYINCSADMAQRLRQCTDKLTALKKWRPNLEIQIKNPSIDVIAKLLKTKHPDGITVIPFQPRLHDIPIDWPTLFVTIVASVPIGVFINWLSQNLIDKTTTKITINRKEIYYDEGEITRMIEETRIIKQGKIKDK